MINTLLTMTLTGSSVVMLWWLLAKLSGDRFSARWHYGVLKLGIFAFLVPVERLVTALVFAAVPKTPKIPTDILGPAASPAAVPSMAPGAVQNIPIPAPAAQVPEPAAFTVPAQLAWALAAIWAAGAVGLLAYKVWSYYRFRRKVLGKNTSVTDETTLEQLRTCQRQVGITAWVPLEQNPYLQTALVMGLIQPVLVIPDTGLSQEELRYIFLHELTHIKSRDLWVRRFAMLAVCLHWWNPCAHLLAREVRGVGEISCDEQVAASMSRQERYEYGKVILKAAADAMAAPEEWAAPFSVRRSLERRLNTMLRTKKMSRKMKALSVTAAAAVLVCGTAMALSADRFLPEQAEKTDGGNEDKSQAQQHSVPSGEEPITYTVPELTLPEEKLPQVDVPDERLPEEEKTPVPDDQGKEAEPVQSPQPQDIPQSHPIPKTQEVEPEKTQMPEGDQEDILTDAEGQEKADPTEDEQQPILPPNYEEISKQLVGQEYPRNSKGETYGSAALSDVVGYEPDLIAAKGTNGKSGYVRRTELFPDHTDKETYDAWVASHQENYTIPVYDSEGNVIGEFAMRGYAETAKMNQAIKAEAERLLAEYEKAKAEGLPFDEEGFPWAENPTLAATRKAARNYDDDISDDETLP